MIDLANVYDQRNSAQAEALDSQVLEIQRRILGPEHPETLHSMNNLAQDYDDQGKFATAESLYSQMLEIQRRVLGLEHPDTLMFMGNLGHLCCEQGKYARAEALLILAPEAQRRVLGPGHPETAKSIESLGTNYAAQGTYDQAAALYRKYLASSPNNPRLLNDLAWFLVANRKLDTFFLNQISSIIHTFASVT